ncbi:glutathione S-transferase, partial [Ochromonadaceae sp. CCMP2298]
STGVYRAGFATQQQAYQKASAEVADALKTLNTRLGRSKYLHGNSVSDSDVYLLPTVERFDGVYRTLFKCSAVGIAELPHIRRWRGDMRGLPGVAGTFDLGDAVRSYYQQMFPLNPSGVIPLMPAWQEED